ncbi:hypothetical protein K449DRAFT_439152 [Hypoxylon sp. EC38]|nr:hypothetical protein K449DRAFT_439152 [Hypoxylon sp. EC38]
MGQILKAYKSVYWWIEIAAVNGSWHGIIAQALSAQYPHGRKGQGPEMPKTHMLQAADAYQSILHRPDCSYDWEAELDYVAKEQINEGLGLLEQAFAPNPQGLLVVLVVLILSCPSTSNA